MLTWKYDEHFNLENILLKSLDKLMIKTSPAYLSIFPSQASLCFVVRRKLWCDYDALNDTVRVQSHIQYKQLEL